MTAFHNFAFKIETSCAKIVFKPILEARNVNVCRYAWFIQFWIKILKRYSARKNTSKRSKSVIKNQTNAD